MAAPHAGVAIMADLFLYTLGPPLLVVALSAPWVLRAGKSDPGLVWCLAFMIGSIGGFFIFVAVGCAEDRSFAEGHGGRAPMISSASISVIYGGIFSPLGAAIGATPLWLYARRSKGR